jgi:hypothetical protein
MIKGMAEGFAVIDTMSPLDMSLRAALQAMTHCVNSSGSKRDNTHRKVSSHGIP